MSSLSEARAAYQHKQQLEQQLEKLKEEAAQAEQTEQEAQMRCERENLDMRKFESSDFRQFWFKLRGQYEQRLLENNEKAAEAMRALNDAKSHVFDVGREIAAVEDELKTMDGVDEAYEKAFAMHVEHLDYSIHREEIMRMQEKIDLDDHQLSLLADARNLGQLAQRKVSQLTALIKEMADAPARREDDQVQVEMISGLSELRIQLHQLEQILDGIDALETETIMLSDKLSLNTLDLFFNKGSEALCDLEWEKAMRQMRTVADGLFECEDTIMHLVVDVETTKAMHQEQLETFISETEV